MSLKLHIDIETYSSVDLPKSGLHAYFESFDFEILMIAYALDNEDVRIIDLANGEKIHDRFIELFNDSRVELHAHNAMFERKAFDTIGMKTSIDRWHCSAVKAAYSGYPLSLGKISEAMDLGELGKLDSGSNLIKMFSVPVKPTKANGKKHRYFYRDFPKEWEDFKTYCKNDVEAEREIDRRLSDVVIPEKEREIYLLDQKINDRGVKIDLDLVRRSIELNERVVSDILSDIKEITGLESPNSRNEVMGWINENYGLELTSIAKDVLKDLKSQNICETLNKVIDLRMQSSKSSVSKYKAMILGLSEDERVKGLFQFYGANRTGRWAGRRVQLQNLPRNKAENLDEIRKDILTKNYDFLKEKYGNFSGYLSELIRTAITAEDNKELIVSDFSAIEARVLAWVAGEEWRIEIFKTHGKIYEASASSMFNIPIEEVDENFRTKGKIAELALGYQGSIGALIAMGGESMGLTSQEMESIVRLWRGNNKKIVKLWYDVGNAAIRSVGTRSKVQVNDLISIETDEKRMRINLPSGRSLYYVEPKLYKNRFNKTSVKFKGLDQTTGRWGWVETYGGKLVENIVQAIARDLLAESMLKLDKEGFNIILHVHDEIAAEEDKNDDSKTLEQMEKIMGETPKWAEGLPLGAVGFTSDYYKKD